MRKSRMAPVAGLPLTRGHGDKPTRERLAPCSMNPTLTRCSSSIVTSGGRRPGRYQRTGPGEVIFASALPAFVGAAVLWWLGGSSVNAWADLGLPAVGAIAGWIVGEFGLRPFRHYMWTVPEQEHVSTRTKLTDVQKKHDEALKEIEQLGVQVKGRYENKELGALLIAFYRRGVTELIISRRTQQGVNPGVAESRQANQTGSWGPDERSEVSSDRHSQRRSVHPAAGEIPSSASQDR